MGCACSLMGRDDTEQDEALAEEGTNDVCPMCAQGFNPGDRILMDEGNVVYHYGCFEGAKGALREGVVSQA